MNVRLLGAVLVVTVLTAASAKAGVYDDCDAAMADGDVEAIEGFADEIRGRNLIRGESMAQAEACVSAAEGTLMVREGRVWVSVAEENAAKLRVAEEAAIAAEPTRLRVCELRELVRQNNMIIREAEAASRDRRIETLSATAQECSAWFEDSPREALTNDICNSIFAAGGLPNSTITGPSQSEVLLAELLKQNAERELTLVEREVHARLAASVDAILATAEEPDEEYQCNE